MRRRAIRASLILLNAVLLLAVVAIVVFNPAQSSGTPQSVTTAVGVQNVSQPIDQLASVHIAVTVARMTNMMEEPAVVNLADSESIQLAVASTNNTVVNKPQVVTSKFISKKDIHAYTALPGDTVSSIASAYGVSTDSILWSNGLTGNVLAAGKLLYIPPVSGIVYVVKSGDTPSNLATKYHADAAKIIAYNDAEVSGLTVGDRILIPDGQIIAPAPSYYYGYGFAWGSNAIYGFNGYDWGNCTWYVATQISVPANWGNAATWAAGARAAGWHVNAAPSVGAIAQTPYAAGGLGMWQSSMACRLMASRSSFVP